MSDMASIRNTNKITIVRLYQQTIIWSAVFSDNLLVWRIWIISIEFLRQVQYLIVKFLFCKTHNILSIETGEQMPSQNFHHSVTFILPLSQNRHSTHRSVTFILPSCQNSHRTHCVMKEPIRFLTYTIRNFNRTFNEQIVNFLQIPSYMNVFR